MTVVSEAIIFAIKIGYRRSILSHVDVVIHQYDVIIVSAHVALPAST